MNQTELVAEYIRARDALMAYRKAVFPEGQRVRSKAFDGRGTVVTLAGPPEKLLVRVGCNTWLYKIEDCEPV